MILVRSLLRTAQVVIIQCLSAGKVLIALRRWGSPRSFPSIIDTCIANERKATNGSLGFQAFGFPKRIIYDASINNSLQRSTRISRVTMTSHLLPFWIAIICLSEAFPVFGISAKRILAASPRGPLGPEAVVLAPNGNLLFIAEVDGRRVDVFDLRQDQVVDSIPTGAVPTGIAVDSDGKFLYVSCDGSRGTVHAIDLSTRRIDFSLIAGHAPIAPVVHPDGRRLYVCNRFDNTVSVFDLKSRAELACIQTVREPCAAVSTPDGKRLFVLNYLPACPSDGNEIAAAVTVIDTSTNTASHIRLTNGSTGLRGACISPDGKRLYIVHTRARYQFPTAQVDLGWMNTNALSIVDTDTVTLTATVLLDEPDRGAANPWAVACLSGNNNTKEQICVVHAGSHELSLIDAEGLVRKLAVPRDATATSQPGERLYSFAGEPDTPDELLRLYAKLANPEIADDVTFLNGLRRRIALPGEGPRGLAIVANRAYVAQCFSDDLAVVDLHAVNQRPTRSIRLGPCPKPTIARRGEMLFFDGRVCRQQWQSCATCHPDGRTDALNWDLLNDGLNNHKNTKSLLLAHSTPPAMWSGVRADAELAVRSGFAHIQFTDVSEEDATCVDVFLRSLKPRPSPHLVGGQLSKAAERGRQLFFDRRVGCANCHPSPLYTDQRKHDVGTEGPFDYQSCFDTPSLVECWRTAPYLHDGRYATLRGLFHIGAHGLAHAGAVELREQQIDDLIEYVISL